MIVYVSEKLGKPQPWTKGAAARNAFRPPTGFRSVREGRARPFEIQILCPTLPVSQLSTVQAACLFFASLAIE